MTRNAGTSLATSDVSGQPDREAAARHNRYATEVWPRLQHEAKVRWFALFGILYPFKEGCSWKESMLPDSRHGSSR